MAANLNTINGKVAYMDANQSIRPRAWHGTGQTVDYAVQTAQEVMELAMMDFHVDKIAMHVPLPNGETIVSDTAFATVRTDNNQILGTVGAGYEVWQNADAFSFFDVVVGEGLAEYETAGVLGDGERIFISARKPEFLSIGDEKSELEQYIFLTNSHNGKHTAVGAVSNVRIVCNNTLNHALKNCTNRLALRHTKNMKDKLQSARAIMGISDKFSSELSEVLNRMVDMKVTDETAEKIIAGALSAGQNYKKMITAYKDDNMSNIFKDNLNGIMDYRASHPTQLVSNTNGTLYGVYNAVTGYFQNIKEYSDSTKMATEILSGSVALRGQMAFDLCQEKLTTGKVLIYS